MNTEITYKPIGIIHSAWKKIDDMPIQSVDAQNTSGYIKLFPEYAKGLTDLNGFSHIMLLYHFHLVKGHSLMVTPFMDTKSHGIFSTRAPKRPNSIGISIVELLKIEGNTIHFSSCDILDETPLLDIKPFFEDFDNRINTQKGWLGNRPVKKTLSDKRFK